MGCGSSTGQVYEASTPGGTILTVKSTNRQRVCDLSQTISNQQGERRLPLSLAEKEAAAPLSPKSRLNQDKYNIKLSKHRDTMLENTRQFQKDAGLVGDLTGPSQLTNETPAPIQWIPVDKGPNIKDRRLEVIEEKKQEEEVLRKLKKKGIQKQERKTLPPPKKF